MQNNALIDMTGVVSSIACLHEGPGNYPGANPYLVEYAIVLVMLWVGFAIWRRRRPEARPLLRWYAGVGGLVAFLVTIDQTCIGVESDPGPGCRLALELCAVVAASLYLEIFLSRRRRRHIALARASVACAARSSSARATDRSRLRALTTSSARAADRSRLRALTTCREARAPAPPTAAASAP